MNILVSDTIKNDNNVPSYRISNTQSTQQIAQEVPETIKEMGQRVAAKNTPVFMVDISSQGRVALQTMKSMESMKASEDNLALEKTTSLLDNANKATMLSGTEEVEAKEQTDEEVDSNFISVAPEEDTTGKDSGELASQSLGLNLAMYSESQLRTLQREGTISSSQLNEELAERLAAEEADDLEEGAVTIQGEDLKASVQMQPVMEQAIAAYAFQMSFSAGQTSLT